MSITFVLNLFLLQTACGMLALCLALPKQKVDRHFFKSIGFFSFLFIAGGLLLRWRYPFTLPETFGPATEKTLYPYVNILYGVIAILAIITWGINRLSATRPFGLWLNCASVLALPVIIMDSLLFIPQSVEIGLTPVLIPVHFVTASLVLGGYLVGMIFGHWYLLYTDMPKRLLVRMASILAATLLVKCLAVIATWLLLRYATAGGGALWDQLISFAGYGIFFWERIFIGLVVPAIVSYMIWSTARIGSNQSATGILYVAVAFIFIGELIAKFLFLFSTIPL